MDEKTGKGQSTLNYKYYRIYKERSYGQTINNWNNIGVIPKIFVWDSKNKSENLTKDCNFEICSIKTIIEYFIDNDINGKSKEFKILLDLVEQIIEHTQYCKTLNINDENYNLEEGLNYQMRYGAVNLLKVVITHYLSLHKEYSDKILSYVDWVVTPTSNLGNLPDNRSIIYGSKVYSGLTSCSENIIENTAIFVNNSRNNSIFSNSSINAFYDRAITFLKCLIESQQRIKNSIEDFIKLDCDTINCIQVPSLFRKNHSFVYNLFIDLIENIEFEQMKTIHKGELSNYLTEKLGNLFVNFDKIKISELEDKKVDYQYLEDIFKEITTASEELISNSGIDYMSQLSLRKSISSFKKRFFDKTEELSILDMHKFFIESRKLFISTISDSLSKDWIKNKFDNTTLAIPICITRRSGHAELGIT